MNILYYHWNHLSYTDITAAMSVLGHTVTVTSLPFADYDDDPVFCAQLQSEVEKHSCSCIFFFDFFPIISKTAKKLDIPYISWVYDMPHTTLFSPEADNYVNHIFIFDHDLAQQISGLHMHAHIYYMPLAADTRRFTQQLGTPPALHGTSYDVSFVGSLYENCLYNQISYLPAHLRGYLDGIIKAQSAVYGANFISDTLTPAILDTLTQWVHLELPSGYHLTTKQLYADMINAKITSGERIRLLEQTALRFPVTLFSTSDKLLVPHAHYAGTVNYENEMPCVFRTSKINLNITLRSITSGIPLRALDIMAAGGFLLSNYQPELDEYFIDGEDCVLFDSAEDLLCKTEYYLSHEKERTEISCNGFHKIQELFSYKTQLEKMLAAVFPNI